MQNAFVSLYLPYPPPPRSHPVQLLGGPAGLQPLQERRHDLQMCVVREARGLRVREAVQLWAAGCRWSLQHRVPQPPDHRCEWFVIFVLNFEESLKSLQLAL